MIVRPKFQKNCRMKSQSFEITYSKSIAESSKHFERFSMNAGGGFSLFGLGVNFNTTYESGAEILPQRMATVRLSRMRRHM